MNLRVGAVALLGAAFVVVSAATALGMFARSDQAVAALMLHLWQPDLRLLFWGLAELGGVEASGLLAFGLAVYLRRSGFRAQSLALVAFPIAVTLETMYKKLLYHPGPPPSVSHGDAPSVVDLVPGVQALGNSFPSGHMTRTILMYGLVAFVASRLAASPALRRGIPTLCVLVVAVMAFDRLYLGVHWDSDVLGGLLLGGTCLVAATIWMDKASAEKG